MKLKVLSLLLALSLLLVPAALAQETTANATIVAPVTKKITAPMSGTLLPFDLMQGDSVSDGDALFTFDTTPVYAAQDGTVAAVFASAGDDASGVMSRYGALAVIEPVNPLYVAASTAQAYDDDDNRYLHAGETLYLKCGSEKGTGRVVSVSGKDYVVEILTGNYDPDDTVRCFRGSGMNSDEETGRGKVVRYADATVAGQGRVAAVHVKAGDSVKTGDLLFELVDAQCARGTSLTVSAPCTGAVTLLNTASGAQVYRGQLLCEIADLTALELSAQVDELDLNRVRVGDVLTYTLDAYEGETFSGTVTQIRPLGTARQNATYFDVRITLPTGKTLLPGMNATVTLGR